MQMNHNNHASSSGSLFSYSSSSQVPILDVNPPHRRLSSMEFLSPKFSDARRSTHLTSAVISLIATILGGSALSLPFMMKQTGIIIGTCLLFVVSLLSAFALDLLVSCSRRRKGANSFENVAYEAFGSVGCIVALILLFSLIFVAIVAYLCLIRDLLLPILQYLLQTQDISVYVIRVTVAFIVVILFPVSLVNSLEALNFVSALSAAAMLILAFVITIRGLQSPKCTASNMMSFLWPRSLDDVVSASGIALSSFCCVFNTLSLHAALVKPTKQRYRMMLYTVMLCACALYLWLALFGLCLAGDDVLGDILRNLDADDFLTLIGCCALGTSLILSLPLLILPGRSVVRQITSLIFIPDAPSSIPLSSSFSTSSSSSSQLPLVDSPEFPETLEPPFISPMTPLLERVDDSTHNQQTAVVETKPIMDLSNESLRITAFIFVSALILSLSIESVSELWSIVGNFSCLSLSFVLPSAFYVSIRVHKFWTLNLRYFCALLLLIVSTAYLSLNVYSTFVSLLYVEPATTT